MLAWPANFAATLPAAVPSVDRHCLQAFDFGCLRPNCLASTVAKLCLVRHLLRLRLAEPTAFAQLLRQLLVCGAKLFETRQGLCVHLDVALVVLLAADSRSDRGRASRRQVGGMRAVPQPLPRRALEGAKKPQ